MSKMYLMPLLHCLPQLAKKTEHYLRTISSKVLFRVINHGKHHASLQI
jgi:hypothetical protein